MFPKLAHLLGRRGVQPGLVITGSYLTDGRRLFRVASQLDAGGRQGLVALEDCLTLEVRAYSHSQFGAMGLWAVRTGDPSPCCAEKNPEIYEAGDGAFVITQTGVD
jgi:hypothetical protein